MRDLCLIARPDHSVSIYRKLLKSKKISFRFITFKVFPEWVKCIYNNKKIQTVSDYCSILYITTIINLLKFNTNIGVFKRLDESFFFNDYVYFHIKMKGYKLIHYWPKYCSDAVRSLKRSNPKLILMADMHMPNPIVVNEYMKSIYEEFGLEFNNSFLDRYEHEVLEHFSCADYILVPSSYVKETMRITFPEKKFITATYGITLSPQYRKKKIPKSIRNFVYAGNISIEKGCDKLLEWFKENVDLNIYLYGKIPSNQNHIFDQYKKYDNIIFCGSVSKYKLHQDFFNYDVGIHLSRYDAYSLAVGEMIGCGLPVIVSEFTGNKDDILNFQLGLVTSFEKKDITSKIRNITDVNTYTIYINHIDSYIKEKHIPFEDKMMDIYRKLIDNA